MTGKTRNACKNNNVEQNTKISTTPTTITLATFTFHLHDDPHAVVHETSLSALVQDAAEEVGAQRDAHVHGRVKRPERVHRGIGFQSSVGSRIGKCGGSSSGGRREVRQDQTTRPIPSTCKDDSRREQGSDDDSEAKGWDRLDKNGNDLSSLFVPQ